VTVALTLKGDGMATVVIFGRVIQPEGSSLGTRRVEIFAKGAQEPSPLVAARVRTDGAFEAELIALRYRPETAVGLASWNSASSTAISRYR
jgi:hypothetical protein